MQSDTTRSTMEDQLVRCTVWAAHHCQGVVHVCTDPKVCNLDAAIQVHEHVCRLDVPVHLHIASRQWRCQHHMYN